MRHFHQQNAAAVSNKITKLDIVIERGNVLTLDFYRLKNNHVKALCIPFYLQILHYHRDINDFKRLCAPPPLSTDLKKKIKRSHCCKMGCHDNQQCNNEQSLFIL